MRWVITTAIASKCASLSWLGECWHRYEKEPTWPFLLILWPFEYGYAEFTLCSFSFSHKWFVCHNLSIKISSSTSCSDVLCFLKYPRLVPVSATEKVSICLTGMDEVFANCDCVLILLLCDTVWNILNADLPLSKIFTESFSWLMCGWTLSVLGYFNHLWPAAYEVLWLLISGSWQPLTPCIIFKVLAPF